MKRAEILSCVVRVQEALVDGDARLAEQLLADLEHGLRSKGKAICPACGRDCRWPGLLDDHLRTHHPDLWEARVAA